MLKTVLFFSIIIKLAFGEDDTDDDVVEITTQTLDELSPFIKVYNDEIEEDIVKTCRNIKKRKACYNGVSKKYPNGRQTDKRGNAAKGECMWFQRRNNPIVQYYGYRCIAPSAVMNARQNGIRMEADDVKEDDDEMDTVEMSDGLFDDLSANAPTDDISEDIMKYCLDIKKQKMCVDNGVSRTYPKGFKTMRRGNDDYGECMWFHKRSNDVVQALGNRCLPPAHVMQYRKGQRPNVEIVADVFEDEEDDEYPDDDVVEVTTETLDELAPFIKVYNDEIEEDMVKTCRGIKKRRACYNGVSTKYPGGRQTDKRGNAAQGECMWFQRRNNPIVQYYGYRCIAPAAVMKARQKGIRMEADDVEEDDEEMDTVEMSDGLFDSLSETAPTDDISDDAMKYCLDIKKERACLNGVSRTYPNGFKTMKRGNDDYGECMWFHRRNNVVVQALGNRCLPPAHVMQYRQGNRPMEQEFFAALGLADENGINYNALSMVIIFMVLISYGAYYKLCKSDTKKSILNGERRPSLYQSV